ncbi:MAG: hypothetical protein QUS33_11840 [Dehalococcoidia bacterium]|nr:hypothetical protein [Dehalococcoidia bacterium]
MKGRLWPITLTVICLLCLAAGIGQVSGGLTDSEVSPANSFQAWISTQWLQTTLADFDSGLSVQADTRSSPGDVTLARDSHIYALQGGTPSFWVYGIPGNTWTPQTSTPNAVGAGGALAYDGSRYIYALRGNNSRAFWRYDIATGMWAARANTPANVGAGGSLAYDGTTYVYALRGNGTNGFWRYDTTLNIWATMANTPAAVAAGGALAYDGTRYVYAFRGNNRNNFWRYDTASDSWQVMANAPARVDAGGALAYDGIAYLYAFRGANRTAFWRYDINNNSWTTMANAPANVGAGGALTYAGPGYIFAFSGGGTTAFWRYDVMGNSWAVMASALGGVGAGGSLTCVGASTYVSSATIASQVRDTGTTEARWDALFWDETLPANTSITFEVRASDTPFAADNAVLPWIPVGNISPITSGLPSGRYIQWRATLTTTDNVLTPVLHEVRAYHS